MTLDKICDMTSNAETLNAVHACRPGHPLNNSYQWRNAYSLCCQRREISTSALDWLKVKAVNEVLTTPIGR